MKTGNEGKTVTRGVIYGTIYGGGNSKKTSMERGYSLFRKEGSLELARVCWGFGEAQKKRARHHEGEKGQKVNC